MREGGVGAALPTSLPSLAMLRRFVADAPVLTTGHPGDTIKGFSFGV